MTQISKSKFQFGASGGQTVNLRMCCQRSFKLLGLWRVDWAHFEQNRYDAICSISAQSRVPTRFEKREKNFAENLIRWIALTENLSSELLKMCIFWRKNFENRYGGIGCSSTIPRSPYVGDSQPKFSQLLLRVQRAEEGEVCSDGGGYRIVMIMIELPLVDYVHL